MQCDFLVGTDSDSDSAAARSDCDRKPGSEFVVLLTAVMFHRTRRPVDVQHGSTHEATKEGDESGAGYKMNALRNAGLCTGLGDIYIS